MIFPQDSQHARSLQARTTSLAYPAQDIADAVLKVKCVDGFVRRRELSVPQVLRDHLRNDLLFTI